MKNKLLILFVSILSFVTGLKAQTTIYTENFNSGGATWTVNTSDLGSNTGDDNYWSIDDTYDGGLLGGTTPDEPAGVTGGPESNYMHITNSFSGNASALAPADGLPVFTKMNTAINTTGYTNVTLTFYILVEGETNSYYGRLYYSTDGGNNWTWWNNQKYSGIGNWTQETVTSSTNAFDNQADLRFAFMWAQGTDGGDNDPALAVDEIIVTGSGASCPVKITGNTVVNPGCGAGQGQITLTATDTTTGSVLTYTINNGTATSNGTGIFTGLATGVYTVQVADQHCSTTGKTDTIVNSNSLPAPTITASKTIMCSDDSSHICVTGTYSSYHWNDQETGQCIYAHNAQNYYVTVTDNSGCSAESNHIHLTVYPVPSVSIVQSGDTLSSYGEVSYQWLSGNQPLAGDTFPIFVATQPGHYEVQITDTNGCTAISTPIVLAVEDLTKNVDFDIYPNPASTGNIQLFISSQCTNCDIEIYDALGQKTYQGKVIAQKQEIDISKLAKGIYTIRVSGGTRKFIKD